MFQVDERRKLMGWQKSSFSGSATQGECVEVATAAFGHKQIRDSKDPDGAILTFTSGEFDAFVKGIKAGEFDG